MHYTHLAIILPLISLTSAGNDRKRFSKDIIAQDAESSQERYNSRSGKSLAADNGLEESSRPRWGPVVGKTKPYWDSVEKKRRRHVAGLRRRNQFLHDTILNRDPSTFTNEEKHELALFRWQLNVQMTNYRRKKAPYLESLIEDLRSMRDSMKKQGEYKDEESKIIEKKSRAAHMQQRWVTRQKAKEHGVDIKVKPGRKTLNDGAPPRLAQRRERDRLYAQKKRQLLLEQVDRKDEVDGGTREVTELNNGEIEEEGVHPKSWGIKKQRSR